MFRSAGNGYRTKTESNSVDAEPSAGEVALGADAAGVADEVCTFSYEGRVAAVRADVGVPAQSAKRAALLRRRQEDEVVGRRPPGDPAGDEPRRGLGFGILEWLAIGGAAARAVRIRPSADARSGP